MGRMTRRMARKRSEKGKEKVKKKLELQSFSAVQSPSIQPCKKGELSYLCPRVPNRYLCSTKKLT